MTGKRLLMGLFAAAAMSAASVASACSRNNELAGNISPNNAIDVHVVNQNFLDVDVYAISEGLPTRLGTVSGNGQHDFLIDPSMASSDLRIVATPVGGMGRASTGAIVVGPGQTIDFRVASVLRNSTVTIR